ncbi:MAG: ATP-dependent DNA ligase [Candidatus Babeliaceae bacterium]|jgi:DNA ligase-1
MKFKTVADYFERINAESSRTAITKLLAELFDKATAHEAQIISYLSLGLLRAPYKGNQFNMADKLVTRVIARLLTSDVAYIDELMQKSGDLGTVVGHYYQHEHEHSATLLSVYNNLELLENMGGAGSQEEKSEFLYTLLASVDALSAQYIVRVVLGNLRLGFSDMTIIDALSWMLTGSKSLHERIEHAYNVCADIGLITALLKEKGAAALDDVSIIIGIPIRPAAAERLPTAQDIFEKIGPCAVQPKLDGFRLQIHCDNRNGSKKRWFYSRNLSDMSDMFPDLVAAFDKINVQTLIVEGEAIVYDENTQSFVPFQETVKRKRKHDVEEVAQQLPLKLFLFDILYHDGESLLNKAHTTRRDTMLHIVSSQFSEVISVISERSVESADALEKYFLENINAGLEGVVVKKPSSHYQPGKRNFNWIKLKYHASRTLLDTIDVVVLGYYYGSGKRSAFGIGAFLVGVYNKHKDCFETLAKVGTGMKDVDWHELKAKCDKIALKAQLHNVVCDPHLAPDVWVAPSLVCVVRADEITISPVHTAGKSGQNLGFALRFPRFIGYRSDKSPEETTSVQEIFTLFEQQKK